MMRISYRLRSPSTRISSVTRYLRETWFRLRRNGIPRKTKDRLQWRLKESELAIVEKDKELAQRLENELQLRHSLELKERQLVSLGVSHGIEISNLKAENDERRRNEHGVGDGNGEGGF